MKRKEWTRKGLFGYIHNCGHGFTGKAVRVRNVTFCTTCGVEKGKKKEKMVLVQCQRCSEHFVIPRPVKRNYLCLDCERVWL